MEYASDKEKQTLRAMMNELEWAEDLLINLIKSGTLGRLTEHETDPFTNQQAAQAMLDAKRELILPVTNHLSESPMKQTTYKAAYNKLREAEQIFMTTFHRLGERASIQITDELNKHTDVLFTKERSLNELLQRHAVKGRLLNGLGSTLTNTDTIVSTFMPYYTEVKELLDASIEGVQLFAPLKSETAKGAQFIGNILKSLATAKYSGSYADKPLKQTTNAFEKSAQNTIENIIHGDLQKTKEQIEATLSELYKYSGNRSVTASLNNILNISAENKAYALLNILSDAIRTGLITQPESVPTNYVESQAHLLRFNPDFGFIVLGNLESAGLLEALEERFPNKEQGTGQALTEHSQVNSNNKDRNTAISRLNEIQKLLHDTGVQVSPIVEQAMQDIKARLQSGSMATLEREISFTNDLYERVLIAYDSGSSDSLRQELDDYMKSTELHNVVPTLIAREYENKALNAVPRIRMSVKSFNDSPISLLKYTGLSTYLPKQSVNLFTFSINQANTVNPPFIRAGEKAKSRAGGIKNMLLNNKAAKIVGEHIGILFPKDAEKSANTFAEQITELCNGDKKRAFNTLIGLSIEASRTGLITTKMEDVYRVLIAVYDGGISDASAESGIKTLDHLHRIDSELKTAAFYCHEMKKEQSIADERGYEASPGVDLYKRL